MLPRWFRRYRCVGFLYRLADSPALHLKKGPRSLAAQELRLSHRAAARESGTRPDICRSSGRFVSGLRWCDPLALSQPGQRKEVLSACAPASRSLVIPQCAGALRVSDFLPADGRSFVALAAPRFKFVEDLSNTNSGRLVRTVSIHFPR